MALNAKVGTVDLKSITVIHPGHPAVLVGTNFKASNGTIPAGTIVALDNTQHAVAYDRAGAGTIKEVWGVCVDNIDTTAQTVGRVLVHGTVVSKVLKHKDADATIADRIALRNAAIFAI